MIVRRVRGKILLIFLILLVTVILSLSLSMGHLFETIFTSQRLNELQGEATTCSHLLSSQSSLEMEAVSHNDACRNTVVLDARETIRKQTGMARQLVKGSDLPGVTQVLEGQSVVLKTAVPSFQGPMFVVGVPLSAPYRGAVFRLESAVSGDQVIDQMYNVLWLAILGAVLLASGVALIVADKMAAPLVRMEQMSAQIIKGDFNVRVPIKGQDELARLSEALNSLAGHLQRVETSRAEFLSNVSHEIRTPLSYVQGYAQILEEGLADSKEEQQRYLAIIQEEVGRARRLLEDLLDLAAFEESGWKLIREPVDLAALTHEMIHKLQPYAMQKGIRLSSEPDSSLPLVMADPLRLQQAMINVIHNAITYTQAGGEVLVKAVAAEGHLKWSVHDNGPGIPVGEVDQIWERFYRLEKSRSRELGGSGLGLSIVRRIVEAHGGQVLLTSEEGRGTVVSWRIPCDVTNEREGGE